MKQQSKYKKLDPISHILLRPDTYIGSINKDEKEMFVVEDTGLKDFKVIKKKIEYTPGFIKLFDEIIVNSSDCSIRTGSVKYIKVNIGSDFISVENDGESITIDKHPTEKVYNPELIFCHLLTGENFDDTQQKVVGGKNGYGAKLTNVFSKQFIIECCDGKKKYKQTASENMRNIGKPSIVSGKAKSYTKITYYPEFHRFNMKEMENDSISLILKRCMDIAAYNPSLKVYVNNILIPIKSMKDYMKMHLNEQDEFFYEQLANGWDVGIAKSISGSFEQVSIINGINTYKGGSHVSYISNQLSKDIAESFSKKKNVNWNSVKEKLFIFLVCKVPNPIFDTQTKETLTSYISKDIHQNSSVGELTIKKILKSDIVESILREIELKEQLELKKLQNKNKKLRLEKLIDANSKKRSECEIFLFEGDSAGDSARNYRDPQTQAIFKLRGKFSNTRKKTDKNILEDKETSELMAAIGLTLNEKPKKEDLRFHKIIIACDEDIDGQCITSQLLNFFSKWKELIEMGMVYKCSTPLLVMKKGKEKKYFYNMDEFLKYQVKNSLSGWQINYKKGLGSLNDVEYKDMVQRPQLTQLVWDSEAEEQLEIWFGKEADLRKKGLEDKE